MAASEPAAGARAGACASERVEDRDEVAELKREIRSLKEQLRQLQESAHRPRTDANLLAGDDSGPDAAAEGRESGGAGAGGALPGASECWASSGHGLSAAEVQRYSRQIILPEFGPGRQAALLASSVLVIGAGGLGCPVLLYLAAAGVGHLGIVDQDEVDLTNLHRQVLHTEGSVGRHKADSAARAVAAINARVRTTLYRDGLRPENACALAAQYDLIVDCSDNPPTRYLANDAAVATNRALVSGAAITGEGQLSVYNYAPPGASERGPCYRCVHPEPPKPDNCARCAEAGVMGPVPGAIGVLQALEAIKCLAGCGAPLSGSLLVCDFLGGMFRTVKLRGKRPECAACGAEKMTPEAVAAFDYRAFTGQDLLEGLSAPVHLLPGEIRWPCARLREELRRRRQGELPRPNGLNMKPSEAASAAVERVRDWLARTRDAGDGGGGVLVVDVRPRSQYDIAHVPGAVSVPIQSLKRTILRAVEALPDPGEPGLDAGSPRPSFALICKRGNESQIGVESLQQLRASEPRVDAWFRDVDVIDVDGGMQAWRREVAPSLPAY